MAEEQLEQVSDNGAVQVTKESKPEVQNETPVVEPEEGRPAGDDPQAVRARKEYQARVRLQKELDEMRTELRVAQEREKLLREQQSEKVKQEEAKIYSLAEVNEAVAQNQITRKQADEYIEKIIFPAQAKKLLEADKAAKEALTPIERARTQVLQYVDYIPELNDRTSENFKKVAREYQRLVSDGLPGDDRTELAAARIVFGELESLKRKREVQQLNSRAPITPVDSSGGGSPPEKIDITKASPAMQADWDRDGLSQADRERRFKVYLDLKAQNEARRGRR